MLLLPDPRIPPSPRAKSRSRSSKGGKERTNQTHSISVAHYMVWASLVLPIQERGRQAPFFLLRLSHRVNFVKQSWLCWDSRPGDYVGEEGERGGPKCPLVVFVDKHAAPPQWPCLIPTHNVLSAASLLCPPSPLHTRRRRRHRCFRLLHTQQQHQLAERPAPIVN